MIRWIRLVLPPSWILWLFGMLYVLLRAIEFLPGLEFEQNALSPRGGLVLAACACYGGFRVFFFHPACRPKYLEWLRVAPWTHRLPLPAGPVHLVLQDAVVIAVLVGLGTGTPFATPTMCLTVFACVYLIVLSPINACTGSLSEAYIAAFGLILAIHLREHDLAVVVVLACLYVVALMGLRRSMGQFPWDMLMPKGLREFFSAFSAAGLGSRGCRPQSGSNRLGFPYERLKYCSAEPLIPIRHALLLSLLAAWLTYAALSDLDIILSSLGPADRLMMSARLYQEPLWVFLTLAAFLRTMLYCVELWPPISFLARMVTRRWIIPGYDHVLLAPLGAMMLGWTLGWCVQRLDAPLQIGGPIVVFGVLIVVLGAGPTLGSWRLLGKHRTIGPIQFGDLIKL